MHKVVNLFKRNKQVLKLAYPIFFELFLSIVIGMVDQFQLSFDQTAVNAIGQVNAITTLINITYQVLTTASLILITQYNGKKDKVNAERIYQVSFYFNLIISSLFSLLLFFLSPQFVDLILSKSDSSEKLIVREKAILYMQITGSWVVLTALTQTFGTFLRANKKMIQTTIVSIIMNVINVIGNSIAIYGVSKSDPSNNVGIIGVAVASTISKFICVIVIICIYAKYVHVSLSPIKSFKNFSFNSLKKLLIVGIPSAGETFSYNFAQTVVLFVINMFVDFKVQGNIKSYANNLASFIYIFASSLSLAMQVIEGELISTKKKEEAKKLMMDTQKISCIFSFVMSIIILAISYPLFSYLLRASIKENPYITICNTQMKILDVVLIIFSLSIILEQGRAFNIVYVKGLQSAGDIFIPVISAIICCWTIAVGGNYLFGYVLKLGVIGTFIANTIDECTRGVIFYIRVKSDVWKKKNLLKDKKDKYVPLEVVEPLKQISYESNSEKENINIQKEIESKLTNNQTKNE